MQKLVRFVKDNSGATAIEYGLIAALIGVAVIGAFTSLGGQTAATFDAVATTLDNNNDLDAGGGEEAPAE